jgi:CheY-like chemotaxis protein
LAQHFLEEAGAQVRTAANGQEALDEVARANQSGGPIDLVLLDMQMPVMDGYEAATRLRHAGFEGAIVALTAHAMKGDKERCLEVGCDAYATKPIEGRRLVEIVARHTQGSPDDLSRRRLRFDRGTPRDAARLPRTEPPGDSLPAATRRVLVVDDCPDACRALELLLQMKGYDLAVARDGRTALEAAARHHPHIVLLDLTLPDMSGHEVARRLRQDEGTRQAMLIAVSGHGAPEDFQRSREAGFDHHVVKPAKIDELEQLFVTDAAS